MFVLSMNSSKIKAAAVITAAAVCVCGAVAVITSRNSENAEASMPNKVKGSSAEERMEFLTSCGLAVDEEPVEVTEIIIPAEFDETYESYNQIQISQGFDLEQYSGKRVKKWTYRVTNYPGYGEDSDSIRVNLLVYNDLIIGGDVCSVELNGFMHGFITDETAAQQSFESESTVEGSGGT